MTRNFHEGQYTYDINVPEFVLELEMFGTEF
jgi:hypothetical protein